MIQNFSEAQLKRLAAYLIADEQSTVISKDEALAAEQAVRRANTRENLFLVGRGIAIVGGVAALLTVLYLVLGIMWLGEQSDLVQISAMPQGIGGALLLFTTSLILLGGGVGLAVYGYSRPCEAEYLAWTAIVNHRDNQEYQASEATVTCAK